MDGKRRKTVLRKLGLALRRQRRQAALTQEALALRAGMERTHVSAIERGEGNPTVVSVVRLCDALEVNPAVVFATLDKWPQ
jgi:transcriptional regulator with XRE-family HTH domain